MSGASHTKVLIADDLRSSRLNIQKLLEHWGYEPVPCEDGLAARDALATPGGPRIAILDWVMPGMTGPEVCKWIAEELGTFVYTIFLTSKSDQQDLVAGLTAGAQAYLTKPARPAELETWIRVGLRMVSYEQRLAEQNERLRDYGQRMESLAEERARQLAHASRMATLGTMSASIAHEINNSTAMLSGNVQTLEKFWPVVREALATRAGTPGADDRLDFILEETAAVLAGMRGGVGRISKIVRSLRTFSRREDNSDFVPCQINECLHAAADVCENARDGGITLEWRLDPALPQTVASGHALEQVFANFIVNACDAMRPQGGGSLTIRTWREHNHILIAFEDTGPGIDRENMENIWNPFYTTKGPGEGTGLGLSISLDIIKDHDGRCEVENRSEGGARFTVRLPLLTTG